ncbi:MAG: hypothetical protein US42_C0001G0044 [Candidatus Magasanikbacteria bacterium GW2011_GWC2_37_14]|uniref:DUF8128 domain-containing protein n=1 Tax=Candidatus Magasanikbacteria bacterium GW2011_GWC2_37_14 TaxID=1619046 RepID=A0A0G0GAR9_9BACT|nr:MAG: hypothetical protein US42_C0001G0044 [Candidatus Magasanikbacteria bacterium GW2011_GWC2_37_14]
MDLGFYSVNWDFNFLSIFFAQAPAKVIFDLFIIGGWVILGYFVINAGILLWVNYRQEKFTHNWEWQVLAIDIPALNIQTPMAVEQMFSQISGAFNHVDITEKYWHGFKQQWFSFEVISIEGYIQFLVRTEKTFRDLVETAVYAQYPDAEIVEVEDYVKNLPDVFPNEEYEMWAADFGPTENWAYPIRTYEEFEHKISKDTVLKDPMGTFLESFARLNSGEQMWFQIIVEPISNHWKEEVIEKIEEIAGVGHAHGGGLSGALDKLPDATLKTLEFIGDQVFGREGGEAEEHEKEEKKELSPGQGKLIEGMENKIQKTGFKTKMRGLYVARKEVFRKERGVHALMGAVSQFNIPNANSLAAVYKTAATSFFAKSIINYRKNLLMKAYKKRKIKAGSNPYVLNIMELATLWHFPMSHVKTPLLQKAAAKQSEPPTGLPVESLLNPVWASGENRTKKIEEGKSPKIGYTTDAGHINYDDNLPFA